MGNSFTSAGFNKLQDLLTVKKKHRKKGEQALCGLTCDNTACDGVALPVAIDDRLHAVGVLHSRGQAGDVNAS